MTRALRQYGEGGALPEGYRAYDASTPAAGYYRYRMRAGGVFGVVRIWHGPPNDPVTGEELDRSHRWQATFNGHEVDIDRVWPACGRNPIDEKEAGRLLMQAQWAREHAPDSAYAEPSRKLDRLSENTPLPF